MSNLGVKTDASGTFGNLTFGGANVVTIDSTGITSGITPGAVNGVVTAPTAITSINGGPLSGRNLAINGCMRINQRGSVPLTTGAGAYTLDRMLVANSGTGMSGTVSQAVNAAFPSGYAMQITGTYTNGQNYIQHRIESRNAFALYNKAGVASVYIWHDFGVATNFSIQAYYANSVDTFSGLTTISSATTSVASNTVTRISVSIPAGTGLQNGLLIQVYNDVATVTSKTILLSGLQVEQGTVATSFDTSRPVGTELALCQRYFAKTFDQSVAPATNTGNRNGSIASMFWVAGVANGEVNWALPVEMRVAPTVTTYAWTGATANWANNAGGTTTVGTIKTGTRQCSFPFAGTVGAAEPFWIHATASAEL